MFSHILHILFIEMYIIENSQIQSTLLRDLLFVEQHFFFPPSNFTDSLSDDEIGEDIGSGLK